MCMYPNSIPYKLTVMLIFFLVCCQLYSSQLRNKTEEFFYSLQWEDLGGLAVKPLPQPFRPDKADQPIAHAGTAAGSTVYPSLEPLGILDYQGIAEDLLQFYDAVSDAFLKKQLHEHLFNPDKPFLLHLSRFIFKKLPQLKTVFYSRPSFDRNGTAAVMFKLTQNITGILPSNAADIQNLPLLLYQQAAAITCNLTAIHKENTWYIDSIDIKGAEYADSSHTN